MGQCHPSEHLGRPTLGQLGGSGLTNMRAPEPWHIRQRGLPLELRVEQSSSL